jgi:6-phosphogluconolactonase
MMRESLLDAVPGIDPSQVHRIHGESIPAEGARLYMDDIRGSFFLNPGELPVFDVIARGMGPDHTFCLAAGEDKAAAIRRVLRGPFDPVQAPAQIALPDTVWYIDKSAGALL